jgi:hypothetical protein
MRPAAGALRNNPVPGVGPGSYARTVTFFAVTSGWIANARTVRMLQSFDDE